MENQTYTFSITRPTTTLKRLLNIGPKEITSNFLIESQVLASCMLIAKKAEELPISILQGAAGEVLIPLYEEHLPKLIWIVAAAITNRGQQPSSKLVALLTKHLTTDQILEGCFEAFEAMNMQAFYDGIAVFKGPLTVLNPVDLPENNSSHEPK
ncbi:hypothetical protein A0256_13615 [Mucilaginibacter sp. PAMC 26640]|nr:hypothetical protein A0256_13615 [Mucilaginibacter sp. PAMC 26640]